MRKVWFSSVWHVLAVGLICLFVSLGFRRSAPDVTPPAHVRISYQSSVYAVNLSWTASTDASGIKGYHVFKNGRDIGFTQSTEYLDTGLQEFTAYTYTIVSMDKAGNTIADAVTARTKDAAPPTAPTDFRYASTANSINLTWTASVDTGGMLGYYLYIDNTYTGFTESTTYTFTGLKEYTGYALKVKAADRSGKTTSDQINVKTSDVTPPPAPKGVTGKANADSVTLSWISTKDTGVGTGYYKIYRNKTCLGTTKTPGYQDKGLKSNTEYVYTIEAYDKNNNGPSSAGITVRTYDDTIRVLSFNILNKSGYYTDPNSVEAVRLPKVVEYLRQYKPDVMGLQEINKYWSGKLSLNFADYAVVGGYDEYWDYNNPIYYLKSKYNLTGSGTIWLGKAYGKEFEKGQADYRTCAWAVFRDKVTGRQFALVNTHLDNGEITDTASGADILSLRKREAEGVMAKINELKRSLNVPILCTGDFNENPSVPDGIYSTMTSGIMKDSSKLAAVVSNKGLTFHDNVTVDPAQKLDDGLPIDYCFVNDFDVLSCKVTRDSYLLENKARIYPSDHFGVFVQVKPR